MFYRGFSEAGEYCERAFNHSSMYSHSPWGMLFGAVGLILLIVVTVIIVKALGKHKSNDSDDLIELLKSKYASGEIDEEEYLRKRKLLKK